MTALNHQFSEYKLNIIGGRGTGKTTFASTHLKKISCRSTGEVEVNIIEFNTTRGKIRFQCWSSSQGVSVYEPYFMSTNGCIIMSDISKKYIKQCSVDRSLYRELRRALRDDTLPVVLCGNKADISVSKANSSEFERYWNAKGVEYSEISAVLHHNCDEPFLILARKLTGDSELQFIETSYAMRSERELIGY